MLAPIGPDPQRGRSRAAAVIGLMVVLVAVPLGITSREVTLTENRESRVRDVAERWAAPAGWDVGLVTTRADHVLVRATGPLPIPGTDDLRTALDEEGLDDVTVDVELVPATVATLDAKAG